LFEINTATGEQKQHRGLGELLSDHISSLRLIGNKLWIGYGHRGYRNYSTSVPLERSGLGSFASDASGGVGFFDLASGKFASFPAVPPLGEDASAQLRNFPPSENRSGQLDSSPPNRPVLWITPGPEDSIYMAVHLRGIQKFVPGTNRWETIRVHDDSPVSAVAASSDYLCIGQRDDQVSNLAFRGKSLWIKPREKTDFTFVSLTNGLPHERVTALLLEPGHLWVGGYGFVAKLSLPELRVTRIFSVPAREVTSILPIAEHLWFSSEDAIYRESVL
jgi:hypothetical protein